MDHASFFSEATLTEKGVYIQGNPAHIRKRAGECVKCFLKAFRTSRSRSWNKTESHTETVKFRSEELSIYVRSSQQGHLRITIITIIHRGVYQCPYV